jgi:hypothetical protein
MPGVVGRISGMDPQSIADMERLLREIRFEAPPVLARLGRPLFPTRVWRPVSVLFGASATLFLILLIFAFWSVMVGLTV